MLSTLASDSQKLESPRGDVPGSPVQPVRHLVGTAASLGGWHTPGTPESQVAAGTQEGLRGSKSMQTRE